MMMSPPGDSLPPLVEASDTTSEQPYLDDFLYDDVDISENYDYYHLHVALVESWLDLGLCRLNADENETLDPILPRRGRSMPGTKEQHRSKSSPGFPPVEKDDKLAERSLERVKSLPRAGLPNLDGSCSMDDEDDDEDSELLELASFLSVDCCLEKRGGSDVPVPNEPVRISRGRNEALKKLEDKASLLNGAVKANVKLGEVFLMRSGDETRSIVTIRVFMKTFTYGIALRWRHGLVNFIVLHKSPPPKQFLKDNTIRSEKIAETKGEETSMMSESPADTAALDEKARPSRFAYSHICYDGEMDGEMTCTVVLQNLHNSIPNSNGGTEVSILQPPWLVPRPSKHIKPTLKVIVHRARGLQNSSILGSVLPSINAYVKVRTSQSSHKTDVVKMKSCPIWEEADNNVARLVVQPKEDKFLKLQIYDQNRIKNICLSTVYVPLALVESRKNDELVHVTMPCLMKRGNNSYGSVTLSLSMNDPKKEWLDAELRERNKRDQGETTKRKRVTDSFISTSAMCGAITPDITCSIGEEEADLFSEWYRQWCSCW